jgi:hypothetical protein
MSRRENIDEILDDWSFDPDEVRVRMVQGDDQRDVLQMRVDMGLLQIEIHGRPDGTRPHGHATVYDYLRACQADDAELELSDEQCAEVDREFIQYYHRRMCWLRLGEFERAVADADHTLALMDLCSQVSSDEEWTVSHEQYRPFVLFHRTQAAAMAELASPSPEPEQAVDEINRGLDRLFEFFVAHEAEELFDEDEQVIRLRDLRESVRNHYHVGRTLYERLLEAVESEQYELAARLRDELARRKPAARRS